ncbi:MAG: hypothetical protein WBH16_06290 [Candidatus Nanopelagicales bacterium]
MARTPKQLATAAEETEVLLDQLDVENVQAADISDLQKIASAVQSIAQGQADLATAVAQARANGRSWARIATVLGVSKQAAHDRFANQIHAAS